MILRNKRVQDITSGIICIIRGTISKHSPNTNVRNCPKYLLIKQTRKRKKKCMPN